MTKATDTITVKIDCDTSAITSATGALNELAAAADRARVALDALFAASSVVTNVCISGDHKAEADEIKSRIEETRASIERGARTSEHRFKL